MNLNDIYSHLINNELPLNGKWVSSAKNDIYTSIDSLSQLIFQAVEPEKGNLQNLRQINKIEDLINEKYRKTESVNFNQIKSTIINSIAENTLTTLEKITNHTKKNHLLAKSALEGLEEIWNQRNYELLTPTEMSRIGDIERNIIRLIDSKKTKILLSKTSLELNLTKVNNYLNHIESIKNAIENRNLSLLKECIESATFPLNIKIDHSGNTILHLISNWPEAIELLLNKTPSLVDEPNDMYEFPSISMSSKEKNQLQLRPIKSHQKQLLDDENLNSHPNTLMMEINNLILNSNDPFSESVICKKFETHPQVILGQRGRNLLCSAIQSGSFPLVKKLLDLGVSPRGVYGLPLSDAAQATSTPLHQAILNKELPIATLLVERGAEISACDRLGRSIMDLIKSQSSLSSNFKISRWIELSTSRSEELKQSRFKKACESKNWPELIQLIHEGFNPGAEIYHLFSGMIRDHQFYLIKLLIEKDYIPAIQPRMIEEILLIAPPVIVRWLLTTLTEKVFLDLPLLLNTALNAKDFGLAAFLINLGAEPQGKDAEALNHYAEALKKGTKAERGLRELINAKNIGHLVGDTIISQMKDDEGRDLEGNSTRESLEFFRAALNFTIEETKTSSLAVMQVSQALQKASELALRIESIFHLGNDRLIANALELLEADLIDEVNKLPIGESIVIPSGWTSGHRGHAIIVECKRLSQDKLELNVINTGDGINYHGVVYKKARLYTNTVRSHILSNTQLKDLNVLRRVVEPNVFSDIKRRFFPEDIYGFLDPFHTHDKKIPNEIELMPKTRKAQLSGTCSLRCWLAYSKLKFPAEYRLIKEVLCEKVIHFAIEQNLMLFDKQPTLTRLLNLSIPVLFHTLSKNLSTPSADLEQKEKQLIKLTSSSLSLQKAIPEAISENKAFLQAPFFATESNQISVAINSLIESPTPSSLDALYQFFSTLSKKHMALPIRAIPLDINQITSTDILEKYLDDLGKSICIPKANTYDQQHRLIENCLTETLITLGRTFLPDSPNTPLKKALETLKNDPLACKRLIGKIYFLTNTLSETSINRFTDNIAHSIALEYALIASWELSCHIDINLKNYRLDLKNLTTWMHAKNSWDPTLKHSPILNFELENDLQQLFEYQKKEKAKKLPSLLNIDKLEYAIGDFSSPSALNLDLSLGNASADFDYAVKAAKTHNNWTLADAQYYLAIAPIKLLNKAPNITLDQWRVHWLYFSGLPNYFHQLRGLAVLANKNKFGRESYSSIASTSTLYLRDTGEEDDKQSVDRTYIIHLKIKVNP